MTAFRNRAGESIGFTVDALGRVSAKDLPGSEPDVAYTYDLLSRTTGASQTGNSLSFTYDALGRNLTQVGPHGTVTSTWDIAGRRTRIAHPDGVYVDQEYLVTGEPTVIRENGATSGAGVLATYAWDDLGMDGTVRTFTSAFDLAGNRTSITGANLGSYYQFAVYDMLGERTSSGGSSTTNAVFNYDDLGRRISLGRGTPTVTSTTSYGYGPDGRLSSLGQDFAGTGSDLTLGFSYNPATTRSAGQDARRSG